MDGTERFDGGDGVAQPGRADHDDAPHGQADAERLRGLLDDLDTLRQYLQERGDHTYDLAQRFLANARRDPSARAYDERQATMLEYQHYIWREIAGRVARLLTLYGDETPAPTPDSGGEDAASE